MPCRDQHAIVIGAGPAGSQAAMALAKQGFRVDVFEKRPEPKLDHVSLENSCHKRSIAFKSLEPFSSTRARAVSNHSSYNKTACPRARELASPQIDMRRSYVIALSSRGVSALQAEGIQIEHQEDAAYLGSVTKRFKGKPSVGAAAPGSVCFDRSVSGNNQMHPWPHCCFQAS